jgi:uncharacterized delta-60 repeat protein
MHKLLLLISSALLIAPAAAAEPAEGSDRKVVIDRLSPAAETLKLDSRGRILALGSSNRPLKLARLVPSGRRDRSFGKRGISTTKMEQFGGSGYFADQIAIDDEERSYILVSSVGSSDEVGVLRIQPDGRLDRSWGDGGAAWLSLGRYAFGYAIALDTDGGVLIGLRVDQTNNGPIDATIVRLTPEGEVDPEFGPKGELRLPEGAGVSDLEVDSHGRIVAAASSGWEDPRPIYRLLSTGEFDETFGRNGMTVLPVGDGETEGIELDSMDRVIVSLEVEDDERRFNVARIDTDGRQDDSFGTNGVVSASLGGIQTYHSHEIAIDGQDRVILGGAVRHTRGREGKTDLALGRLESDGSRDRSFGDDGALLVDFNQANDRLEDLAVSASGEIAVAGTTQTELVDGFERKAAVAIVSP